MRWDLRSLFLSNIRNMLSRGGVNRPSPSETGTLRKRMGRAMGLPMRDGAIAGFDKLEERVMLDGDFGSAVQITLAGGLGDSTGAPASHTFINPAIPSTNNDFFRFTADSTGFVSILADTRNETPASVLNTRVQIFNSAQQLIATGTNNGALTSGLATDGWAGFVAQAGQEYFVVVSAEQTTALTTANTYTLRINAENRAFLPGDDDLTPPTGIARDIGQTTPPDFALTFPNAIVGELARLQQDILYRYDIPDNTVFDSLVTVNAQVTQANRSLRLDTRLDIYKQVGENGAVQVVAFDSDAGRLNDAFTAFRAKPGETYFIRVRSDELRAAPPPNFGSGVGSFYLVLDGVAAEFPNTINPITRRASDPGGAFFPFGDEPVPDDPNTPTPVFQNASYRFTSRGTGLTIISVLPTGLAPVTDPAVRLFDDQGNLIAFNDNAFGFDAEIRVQLVGGRQYFVVIDGFQVDSQTQYQIFLESNHTFDVTQPIDDHLDFINLDGLDPVIKQRFLRDATPLVFNQPFDSFDADGNLIRDFGMRAAALGEGRVWAPGDTDIFVFTAPKDMLGTHGGNNDDAGTSLFVGGNFDIADPNVVRPTTSRVVSNYDAEDWWYTGRQNVVNGVQFGFTARTTPGASAQPEVYAMTQFDVDGAGPTQPFLIVGGDFDLTIPGPLGPITLVNIAAWGFNPQTLRYQWFGVGDADGPVRALTTWNPPDPDGDGPALDPNDGQNDWLVAGGDFTTIGGAPATGLAALKQDGAVWESLGDVGSNAGTPSVRALAVYPQGNTTGIDPGDARDQAVGFYYGMETLAAGNLPRGSAVGDLDGDGDNDFVVTNAGANSITVYINNSIGVFTQTNIAVAGTPTAVALVDTDRDGDLDIITVNQTGNNLTFLRNNGDNTFTNAGNKAVGNTPVAIAVGRLNNDGFDDIVVANQGGNSISRLLNDGTILMGAVATTGGVTQPNDIAIVDADDDGDQDVVTTHRTGNAATEGAGVYVNPGTGVFGAPTIVQIGDPAVLENPISVDAVADGVFVTVLQNSDEIVVVQFDGAFTPQAAISIDDNETDPPNPNATSAITTDINGDGNVDLLITDGANARIIIMTGSGLTFGLDTNPFPATMATPIGLSAGDFNGDGVPEIVVGSTAGANVGLLFPAVNPGALVSNLFVGGSFDWFLHPSNQSQSLIRHDGGQLRNPAYGARPDLISQTVFDGRINALTVYESPDPDGDGPLTEQPVLVIGGAFTQTPSGDAGVGGLVTYGWFLEGVNTADPAYNPTLLYRGTAGGTDGEVFALTVWDPIDTAVVRVPRVVVGGQFVNSAAGLSNNIAQYAIIEGTGDAWATFATNPFAPPGVDGPVFALTAYTDEQEPDIPQVDGSNQEVLAIGGAFTDANGTLANNVVHFFMTNPITEAFGFVAMGVGPGGVAHTDENVVPAVFALAAYDDGNAAEWDRHDRPASRLDIMVSPVEGSHLNTTIRVFDSAFNLVYTNQQNGGDNVDRVPWSTLFDGSTFPFDTSRSGMVDPNAAFPPTLDSSVVGIPVWGGETYYIEVTGTQAGRYTMRVIAETQPADLNDDGLPDEVNGAYIEETNEGFFNQAVQLTQDLATGDGTNDIDVTQPNGRAIRPFKRVPSLGGAITQFSNLGNIVRIDDTDVYVFRAEFTGNAEVRINTSLMADTFSEAFPDGSLETNEKTFSSLLDSALRIFNNDFQQIAYNDENSATSGDVSGNSVGDNDRTFWRRDARVVFPVVAGNFYYIQVESGQRYLDGAPAEPTDRTENISREIDWRYATGAYELLIHQMPDMESFLENGVEKFDDHHPGPTQAINANLATPIAIGAATDGPTLNGTGSITGRIDGFFAVVGQPDSYQADIDLFTFSVPGSGNAVVRLTRTAGSTLNAQMTIIDEFTGLQVATGVAQGNGTLQANVPAIAGNRYLIIVQGQGQSEGGFRIDISGVPEVDDFGDSGKLFNAQTVTLLDFQGQGTIQGTIEAVGDTDIFRFSVDTFSTFTIQIIANDPTLDPVLTVYEMQIDPAGNPVMYRIGRNDDASGTTVNSAVSVPVSAGRELDLDGDDVIDVSFPYYYIVVEGFDPTSDFGRYTVAITFPPTDDHPDGDTDLDGNIDTGEFPLATSVIIDPTTGLGGDSGIIERITDSDLFTFTAAATGDATFTVTRAAGSLLRHEVFILDATGAVLAQGLSADTTGDTVVTLTTGVVRGTSYFIVVRGFEDELNPNVNTERTGGFTLELETPPVDDYPNQNEFDLAHPILLDPSTGLGQIGTDAAGSPLNAQLSYTGDTDLFTFSAGLNGAYQVRITPLGGVNGDLAPVLTIIAADRTTVVALVTATSALQEVSFTIPSATLGDRFFVLVSANGAAPGAVTTGEYRVIVQGPSTPVPPPPTDPGAIDFNNPTVIALDPRTADGQANASVEVSGDRDLFRFTAPATGRIFVQVVTPTGSLLDASVRVLNAPNENASIAFDADGIPGATANVVFNGTAGQTYWVIVDGLGDSVGSYQIRINAQPAINRLYFPEGFATDNIREFVSIVNPNNVDATYTVYLKYEFGPAETVVGGGIVRANSRDGLTIIDGPLYATPGILKGVPYSIVVESNVPLGATLAHYDFGTAIGDSLTERTSATWHFARVEKSPGAVLDYLVFYNPNPFDVNVTITAYQNGQAVASLTRGFGAERRGGFSINDIANFPTGVFSVVLKSEAANPANAPAHIGVVASQSHYETAGSGAGFAVIGDPDGGAIEGAITNLVNGASSTSDLTIFNAGDTPATVTLRGTYVQANLPQFIRTVSVPARSQVRLAGAGLGLVPEQPIGIVYTSDLPVSVTTSTTQFGDGEASTVATTAGTNFYFGDAFINTADAGRLYFETLFIHNPASFASTVTINLVFLDGTTSAFNVAVGARGFTQVKLHERPEIIQQRSGPLWFGVEARSANPFVISMTHVDLLLNGAWATSGTPFGLTNPLSRI